MAANRNQRRRQSTQSISCAENLIKSPSRRKDKMATRLSTIPTGISWQDSSFGPLCSQLARLPWHLFARTLPRTTILHPLKIYVAFPRVAGIFQFLVIFSMAEQMKKSQHFNNVLWLSRIITLGLPFRPVRVYVWQYLCTESVLPSVCVQVQTKLK